MLSGPFRDTLSMLVTLLEEAAALVEFVYPQRGEGKKSGERGGEGQGGERLENVVFAKSLTTIFLLPRWNL